MNNLSTQITSIDWNNNCTQSTQELDLFNKIESASIKLAIWCKIIENVYNKNLALPFIREAQVSMQDFCCLISLGLYKSSASSLRTILESFLYFSYYKDHYVELNSLLNGVFISKSEILEYHQIHTIHFKNKSQHIGLSNNISILYSELSAIIHGQKPGSWHSSVEISNKCFNSSLACEAAGHYIKLIELINYFMLIIIPDDEWLSLDLHFKQKLLHFIDSKKKDILQRHS